MQLDEKPVGAAYDAHARLFPESETTQRHGRTAGDGAIFDYGFRAAERASEVGDERALHDEGPGCRRAADGKVAALALRRDLVEGQFALVNGIDFGNLRGMPEARRHGEIGVAAGLGEDPHLGIDAAEKSASRIGEREISVNEGIARLG